jgi:hypothetical protein
LSNIPKRKTPDEIAWGSKGGDARLLAQFIRLFSRMKVIWDWCFSWHRRLRGGRPFDRSERLAVRWRLTFAHRAF